MENIEYYVRLIISWQIVRHILSHDETTLNKKWLLKLKNVHIFGKKQVKNNPNLNNQESRSTDMSSDKTIKLGITFDT